MRRIPIVVALVMAAISVTTTDATAPARAQARATYPSDLVWLGLGDSYSSGEGLRFIDAQANPPGHDCQRATGTTTVNGGQGSRAWAKVAYDLVRSQMTNSTFQLLACTGAVSNEIHAQYRDEWGSAHPGVRADLLTLSMGGNNLGFPAVIKRCIGLALDNSTGAAVIVVSPATGCDTTEAELKAEVDQLVGTSHVGPDGGQTLRDMYTELANNAVNRGGNIIVAGYPNIVEESGRWVLGLLEGNRCHRIRRADATMLRSVTGYFNQQIALLVAEMNHQIRDVGFTWVDVSKVYEADNGSRHGLCTGDPWINGVTLGTFGPHDDKFPFRVDRSFHPTQDGHDATGAKVAEEVGKLDWSYLDRTPDALACTSGTLDRSIPADIVARFTDGGTLVDGVTCAGPWILIGYRPAGIDGLRLGLINLGTGVEVLLFGGYAESSRCITDVVADPQEAAVLAAGFSDNGPCSTTPAAPTPAVALASCISLSSMYVGMSGSRDQVALFQATLVGLGYDAGEIDGYFGEKTFTAAVQESFDHMPVDSFEVGIDEQTVLDTMFQRLGIAC
jgi:GDSL-like Lipase/Acylhydrolase family